jgi:SAM-dependent methyltransferase
MRADENPNQRLYDTNYAPSQLEPPSGTAWDRQLVELRMRLIRKHGTGKDVLDLCCGTGSYLIPNLSLFRSVVAVDFSETMLKALRSRLPASPSARVDIRHEDAQELSLADDTVDFVWSYTALYYVPDLPRTLYHVARVLRPGGHAALELGNSRSLNQIVSVRQHRETGAVRPYYRPYSELRRLLADAGLTTVEWHAFQLLTMYGAPRSLRALSPLFSARWKTVVGFQVGGRSIDEWVSGSRPLRHLAFRHLVLVRRP